MGINEFLKVILEWIYGFVGNYGWAVVLFTLLVRLIVMPFDYKSRVGMRKMQKIAPMQAKLQKKYEKDPDKMNKKLQELYREQRVNPLSSCLPMLISFPILIAMFTAMRMVANEHLAQQAFDIIASGNPALDSWLWVKNVSGRILILCVKSPQTNGLPCSTSCRRRRSLCWRIRVLR